MENRISAIASPALVRAMSLHRLLLLIAAACLLMACGTTGVARAQITEPTAGTSTEVGVEYPEPLRGHWMPKDMACPVPINYDSDSLIVIDQGRLAHYEDGNKPVRVREISDEPQAWVIESLLNLAGDGYDIPVTEIFVLGGGGLTIAGKDEVGIYRKCD